MTENWYEWLKKQRPFLQTVFRALQSVAGKADDGADVSVVVSKDVRNRYVSADTRTLSFVIQYDSENRILKAYWERKRDAENYTEYRIKRGYEYVEDEDVVRKFIDTVAELLTESVRRGFDADRAYEKLKPFGERLTPGAEHGGG